MALRWLGPTCHKSEVPDQPRARGCRVGCTYFRLRLLLTTLAHILYLWRTIIAIVVLTIGMTITQNVEGTATYTMQRNCDTREEFSMQTGTEITVAF